MIILSGKISSAILKLLSTQTGASKEYKKNLKQVQNFVQTLGIIKATKSSSEQIENSSFSLTLRLYIKLKVSRVII